MFSLSKQELSMLEKKLDSFDSSQKKLTVPIYEIGCPNCNGQCKNGCGVTCVSVFS